MPSEPAGPRWLVLIHQIPPKPTYLRAKVGRRLQGLGAVAVKNSVYVLPRSDQALEDFQWVRREIVAGKGDATVCEASFVEGLSDLAVEAMFKNARDAEYASLVKEARALLAPRGRKKRTEEEAERVRAELLRLRKRLDEIANIDYFEAEGRTSVEETLGAIEATLRPAEPGPSRVADGEWRGRVWVTRTGVHIDRIASAWLIRRFIDLDARFKFVAGPKYAPEVGELRFDMFEAEFTHEGPRCTFEVLLERFGLREAALRHLGEIVHDVDLKDARFGRPEAAGIDRVIAGIVFRHRRDEGRLEEGAAVFESLYESFKRKPR